MFCSACGKNIPEDSLFCEFCGAQRASPSADPTTALSRKELSGMLLKSLSLGEKFMALGSLAGIVGFFLPWGSIPNLSTMDFGNLLRGTSLPTPTSSTVWGFEIARMWGGFYFVLLGAVAAGILFLVSGKSPAPKKLTISAFQVLIGSLIGPQMLLVVLFTPMAQQVAGFGWWVTCLGYCAVAAGGIISVAQIGRQAP